MPSEINGKKDGSQRAQERMQQCVDNVEEVWRRIRGQVSCVECEHQSENEQDSAQMTTAPTVFGINLHFQNEMPFLPQP